jgi:hypothetical protein
LHAVVAAKSPTIRRVTLEAGLRQARDARTCLVDVAVAVVIDAGVDGIAKLDAAALQQAGCRITIG